jgi:hypothetical protein
MLLNTWAIYAGDWGQNVETVKNVESLLEVGMLKMVS